ncbi:hypothetical protein [Nitrospira sp. Nam74]
MIKLMEEIGKEMVSPAPAARSLWMGSPSGSWQLENYYQSPKDSGALPTWGHRGEM